MTFLGVVTLRLNRAEARNALNQAVRVAMADAPAQVQADDTVRAVFGRIGLMPDRGVMHLLPRVVDRQKAKKLVFTARTVDAKEAKQLSTVYDIVNHASTLVSAACALAGRFSKAWPTAIGLTKKIMGQSFELNAHAMAEPEACARTLCRDSSDHMDAARRFRDELPMLFDRDSAA